MEDGLIMMGDLPKKVMIKMWIGLIVMGDLPKWMMMAQRRTWNEVGLENTLPKRWWLKGTLEMR